MAFGSRPWPVRLAQILAFIAFAGFLLTFLVEASFRARAVPAQLARTEPSPVGPVLVRLADPEPVLLTTETPLLEGRGEQGARLLDAAALERQGQTPLKLATIVNTLALVRVTALIAALLAGLAAALAGSRPVPPADTIEGD